MSSTHREDRTGFHRWAHWARRPKPLPDRSRVLATPCGRAQARPLKPVINMDRDAAIAAMLGGASESAAKRGGQAKRRIRTDTEPTLAATACSYYDNDSSSGLRLVQVQTVAAAAVLAPQSLVATSQELANPLKRLLHRGKEDIPDAAAVVAAGKQSPLMGSAAARGLRGLIAGSTKAVSAEACEVMRLLGVTLRGDLVSRRAFLPAGISEGTDTLELLETTIGATESCASGAQLILEGLYPQVCRASAKLTSVDWDEDVSPLLQTSGGAAAAGNVFGVLVDVVTSQPAAAEAALNHALAEGLLAQLTAMSPRQLAILDDLFYCLTLSDGLSACGAAGSTLAGMVAAARTRRATGSDGAVKLADTLREGFQETISELSSEPARSVGVPRVVLMVAELDVLIGLVAALELDLGEREDGGAAIRRGDCIQVELWRDEAATSSEEGDGYLVTVSQNGKPVRSTRHFGALIPLQKLFVAR